MIFADPLDPLQGPLGDPWTPGYENMPFVSITKLFEWGLVEKVNIPGADCVVDACNVGEQGLE